MHLFTRVCVCVHVLACMYRVYMYILVCARVPLLCLMYMAVSYINPTHSSCVFVVAQIWVSLSFALRGLTDPNEASLALLNEFLHGGGLWFTNLAVPDVWYVYVCVCVCMCLYVFVYECMCVYMCVCLCMYVCTYICFRVCLCM